MPLDLALARSIPCTAIHRYLVCGHIHGAANDNTQRGVDAQIINAALRHFAQYGLAAAQVARERAEQAFFAGNMARYDHWRLICRALDRRMAQNLVHDTSGRDPEFTSRNA